VQLDFIFYSLLSSVLLCVFHRNNDKCHWSAFSCDILDFIFISNTQRLEFIYSRILLSWKKADFVKSPVDREIKIRTLIGRIITQRAEFILTNVALRKRHHTKVRKMSGSPLLKYVYNTGGWRGLYSNIIEMQFHRECNAPSGYCKTILLCSIDSARIRVRHLTKVLGIQRSI